MKKIAFKIYFDVEVNGKVAGVSHVKCPHSEEETSKGGDNK